MGKSGVILDSSSVASYLEDANKDYNGRRTWANMYSSLDLMRQQGINQLEQQYSQNITNAFANNSASNSAIAASNLGTGFKDQLMRDNDAALEEAYNASLQNYLSGTSQFNSVIGESLEGINNELTKQADYTSRYSSAHFDYLQDIWNKYEAGELSSDLFNENNWSKYTNVTYDDLGNVMYDENGKPIRSLKSISEIRGGLYDEYDDLNMSGVDFFDQMENDLATRGMYSFGEYLADNDVDLFDWATSYNPYDYAPNALGNSTMASSFNTMVGRLSKDAEYSFVERSFGMKEGQINDIFADIMEKAKASDETNMEDFAGEINKLTTDLGINPEEFNIDKLESGLRSSIEKYNEVKNKLNEFEKEDKMLAFFEDGDTAMNRQMHGKTDAEKRDEIVEELNIAQNEMQAQYQNIVTSLATYAQGKRRQSEIDFYGKELESGGTIKTSNNRISKYDTHTNYLLPSGKNSTYIDSITKVNNSNIRDKKHDNFSLNYNGEKYKLEVSADDYVMDASTQKEFNKMLMSTKGRSLQEGDLFHYENRLWVASKDKKSGVIRVRAIQNRGGLSEDYDKLLKQLKSDSILK